MRQRSSLLALLLAFLVLLAAGCGGVRSRTPAAGSGPSGDAAGRSDAAVETGSSPGEDGEDAWDPLLTLKYTDPGTGLSLGVPGGWTAYEMEDAVVAMISPQNGEEDFFRENVLVTADDRFPDPTLETYVEALEAEVRNRYPDTETLESGDIVIDGVSGRWIVDRFTGPKGDARVYRTVLVRDGTAYVLHGTALAWTFDTYRPIFEAVARSFTWEEPGADAGTEPGAEGG